MNRKQYVKSCDISELLTVELGGHRQKILIEGKRKDLPVLICLHGGPGSPVPFSVGCRGLFPEWTENVIMVYWDQLGCGANNFKIDDGFKIENFVEMTCDLIRFIKNKFPQNKLFLFGISWGSVLALNAATLLAEELDGVLVYGQVLKNLFFNDEVASAFETAPKSAKSEVLKILGEGTGCGYAALDKNLKKLYKLLSKHTNAYFNKNSRPAPVGAIVKGLLTSPDYKFRDFIAVAKNGYAKNTTLWQQLLNIDLSPLLAKVGVKYLMLQGDTDIVTSTKNVLAAVDACGNENVTVKTVENSGHMPSAAAMEECLKTIIQFTA